MSQATEGLEIAMVDAGKPASPVATHKGKRRAGRKPGYRMESWQKEIQLASVRNKDLESFNRFLGQFVQTCLDLEGEVFFIPPESGEKRFFYEDHLYVLRQCICRDHEPRSSTRFFFQGQSLTWKKVCLGAFDFYRAVRDKTLFPEDESIRTGLYKRVRSLAGGEGLKFADQKTLDRNLSTIEVAPPRFDEDALFSGECIAESLLVGAGV